MEEVFQFLKKLEVNFLATTTEKDHQAVPSCRPFGDPVKFNGKIYILTMEHKDVAKQIAENNHVCVVAYDGEKWLRVFCQAIDDSDNMAAKQAIINEFDWAKEAGYTLDNPDFKCYYLANAEAEVRDSDGQVINSYKF